MERVQLVTRKRVALSKHGERTVRSDGKPEQLGFQFDGPRLRGEEDSVHAALGYSEWRSDIQPPCAGWWEGRFREQPDVIVLLWFQGFPCYWATEPEGSTVFDGSEAAFKHFEWRGLLKPDPRGYDYRVEGYYKARIPVVA